MNTYFVKGFEIDNYLIENAIPALLDYEQML